MRKSGILMHISSLPSPYGIGNLGQAAEQFVDFLVRARQSYWQMLPICPTGYGDSPYQSVSTFAGNPYFIDFDALAQDGLLERAEYEGIDWESPPYQVNYGALYEKRYPVLRLAAERFLKRPSEEFRAFCREQADWLTDYALFMTIKDLHDGASWVEWPQRLRSHDAEALRQVAVENEKDILFWKAVQFFFFRQWSVLKRYANQNGIHLIGDLPFYVALDSVDVWADPQLFQLDEEYRPIKVAGCPPDGFSSEGQRWGNPLYRWETHAETGYEWWIHRIGRLCRTYDVLRIDHFRGFDSYYGIPRDEKRAGNGRWYQGPGMQFFHAMNRAIGPQRIIAEDLGFLTDSVKRLLEESGFPGMKILEFAFDRREAGHEAYLPHNYPVHCVAYTGTHDNDTINGWFASASSEDVEYAKEYLRLRDEKNYHWDMICALMGAAAELVIIQAQDFLGYGSESRMNTPSTLGENWRWRALPQSFDEALADKIRRYTALYGRTSV